MIDDPYKILGVSPEASQEEIKKAYRKKAKEYHPDLHPDDPNANRKMNDVNTAYDILMNPDKYAARRAQQQQQQQQQQYYNTGYGRGYDYSGQQRSSNTYRGSGGWQTDFDDFNFEDLFGFGFGDSRSADSEIAKPRQQPGDSVEIQQVINAINSRQYQQALDLLTHIPSTRRNSRWYYLSGLANHFAGYTVQAVDHMQKAAQMDPNNRTYHLALQQFRRSARTYQQNGQGFNMNIGNLQTLCIGLCIAQTFCGPFGCIRC